tara:strand:- start:49 stop:1218 length:1170 start_codon:yes stop_codon:yes gene_type:complete
MSKYTTKFINHASFSFENEQDLHLIDPWFGGKIFNNSWSLLEDTDPSTINLSKVASVFITHEHPDHLNWPTLKQIINASQNVKAYIPKRKNDNVTKALQKLGYEVIEAEPHRKYQVNEQISFYSIPEPGGHDTVQVFEVDGEVHVNQNDCYLPDGLLYAIKMRFPKIKYWWMQFSLAGYYANHDDHKALEEKGKKFHMDIFTKYHSILQPEIAIPFASYVYFCKKHNDYLNKWAVSVKELVSNNPQIDFIVPKNNQDILEADNDNNIMTWENLFGAEKDIAEPLKIADEEIINLGSEWLIKTHDNLPIDVITLGLYDDERNFSLDFKNRTCYFSNTESQVSGILPKEELHFFLKFPWGADTLNITSCFEVLDDKKWRFLLEYKDSMYVR